MLESCQTLFAMFTVILEFDCFMCNWASPSLAVACGASAWNFDTVSML